MQCFPPFPTCQQHKTLGSPCFSCLRSLRISTIYHGSLISLYLCLQMLILIAGAFHVQGPYECPVAVLGGEAQLPCSLWPPQNVENMQITWTRSLPSQVVHQYKDGRDKPEEVMPEYFGRTELVRYAMYNGIVTLKIYNVRSSDRGKYRCAFQHGSDYSDTMTELRVEVAALTLDHWMTVILPVLAVTALLISIGLYIMRNRLRNWCKNRNSGSIAHHRTCLAMGHAYATLPNSADPTDPTHAHPATTQVDAHDTSPTYADSTNHTTTTPKASATAAEADLKNRIQSKYDPEKEEELRLWIEGLMGTSIGPNFQESLKDGAILCTLMNKLQPGSVAGIRVSQRKFCQIDNLSKFIKAMENYGVKKEVLFEPSDLCENGNLWQVQVSLLALKRKAEAMGHQCGTDTCDKYLEKQEQNFDETTMKADQCIIQTQMGTNQCAGQSGMTAPSTQQHIYDTTLGTDKCDNSSISGQMDCMQHANQSDGDVGLNQQIYDHKYCQQGPVADGAPGLADEFPSPGKAQENLPLSYQEEAGY
ncbi:LOW QUALITY PROTEIN: calponin-2-like [Desmodus rotundus]|uniref:LOW QUALITY PROTEIN: calponin-2-like n=1 Tax=Desmodus rotundus TaxID=9430 RepID=UPI002380DE4E|nr:LOW QUALITY PROTEIN: calponin-2-like [Desmodus rotundus]